MAKKILPIKYTSREFTSIKQDLVEHAKRYYPSNFKDFNEGSFGSLMLDTVAYVGDILSFYLDYQANESFLDTANEFNNIIKISKQLGFKYQTGKTSTGICTFYVAVPATTIGPTSADKSYAPVLKKGSVFSTGDKSRFILAEDVRFDIDGLEEVPLKINSDGIPISFGIKSYGRVISGTTQTETFSIGEFKKYPKIKLSSPNVVEIISVLDTEGNEYYEVDYLSQNVIYKPYTNKDAATAKQVKEVLKPFIAARRFTVESDFANTYLQFGGTSDIEVSDDRSMLADPARVILDISGKDYVSTDSFDPSRIQNNDKLGIAPSSTTLTVTYRYNTPNNNINYPSDSLNEVTTPIFVFNSENTLQKNIVSLVKSSLEITNESPIIGDVAAFDSEELKLRIKNTFSAQSRAVTLEDYKALAYAMPAKYGAIKRATTIKHMKSNERSINLYVLSEDGEGRLAQSNQILKNNLKNWLLRNKMINDVINIYDGKIINYGIDFTVVAMPDRSKSDVLSQAIQQLRTDFYLTPDFGEPFIINKILLSLRKLPTILDIVNVDVVIKNGGNYSVSNFNINEALSSDKRFINVPSNAIMELRYPKDDIKGTIL